MKVLKFGGSSVAQPESINQVIAIVRQARQSFGEGGQERAEENLAVVVSAFGGATDRLINMGTLAAQGDKKYERLWEELAERHLSAASTLISSDQKDRVAAEVKKMLNELKELLHGVSLIKEISVRSLDLIMSFGERLSAYIVSAAMNSRALPAIYVDARELVKTDDNFGNARVDDKTTYANLNQFLTNHPAVPVITGFIGSTALGATTTLGRGGSDYTAALVGAALSASAIEIWTDVDGVMTADPRKVPDAFPVAKLTYEETMELSHFGAKVIYPPTVRPALEKNIPLIIKNTFNPKAAGTWIDQVGSPDKSPLKGISSISDIALLNVQGTGIVGTIGTARRVFSALAQKNINVILITQASSEHSICVAVESRQATLAKQAIEEDLALEIETGRMEPVAVGQDLSVIAVVGEGMKKTLGIAGRIFQALGKNGVNIVAIAQGSSELNISMVVRREDETRALNVIHQEFFPTGVRRADVFLVGTGLVGGTVLKQLFEQQLPKLERGLDLRVIGLADSQKMLFNSTGIALTNWRELLETRGKQSELTRFINEMICLKTPRSVFVDCTASEATVKFYPAVLAAGIPIVTPNKKANSGKFADYSQLKNLAATTGTRFLYETNVGAGLPIISTLNDLISSGDRIIKIEAVLSGTLSYIFNVFSATEKTFSAIVKEAKSRGYTEPDPRDDLSGLDVARKLLILGRVMGIALELEDVNVENLLSESCYQAPSVDAFLIELQKMDAIFETKKQTARPRVLRYIALLENGRASVSLQTVGSDHPFYSLSGSDNIISFTTARYNERPLVVRGPGAGAEVTAAGVLADILRLFI